MNQSYCRTFILPVECRLNYSRSVVSVHWDLTVVPSKLWILTYWVNSRSYCCFDKVWCDKWNDNFPCSLTVTATVCFKVFVMRSFWKDWDRELERVSWSVWLSDTGELWRAVRSRNWLLSQVSLRTLLQLSTLLSPRQQLLTWRRTYRELVSWLQLSSRELELSHVILVILLLALQPQPLVF